MVEEDRVGATSVFQGIGEYRHPLEVLLFVHPASEPSDRSVIPAQPAGVDTDWRERGDDAGDVVSAAAVQRQSDEVIGTRLWFGMRSTHLSQVAFVQEPPKAVRCQHEAVAWLRPEGAEFKLLLR